MFNIMKGLTVVLAMGLMACSQDGASTDTASGVIPEYQKKALEKAKSTEDALKKAAEERLKKMP